jgi:thiol-disulfide isomerase/thioredoxin
MSTRIMIFAIVTALSLGACDSVINGIRESDETETEPLDLGLQSSDEPTVSTETQSPASMATDFTLSDLNGNVIRLSSLRGKPVLLNFWATWCGPCVAEMPGMQQLHQEAGDQVHFVCVNLRESQTIISGFLGGKGYNWTFLMDPSGDVARVYEISAIPTTIVISSEGHLKARHVGSMNHAAMRAFLEDGLR